MGRYFNPTEKVFEIGRPLKSTSYQSLCEELQEDEELVAFYHRLDLPFDNVPSLHNETEYNEFERQAKEGLIIRKGFFALKKGSCV